MEDFIFHAVWQEHVSGYNVATRTQPAMQLEPTL